MEVNRIYNENCLDTMGMMADNFIDLTVTSPPYDNLRTYSGEMTWNEDVWRAIIKELYRVTKKGGVVVWVVGDSTVDGSESGTSFKQALCAKECGFNLHDTMIYSAGRPPRKSNRYEQEFEYMFVFSKGKPKAYNLLRVPCKYAGKSRKGFTHRRTGDTLLKGTYTEFTHETKIKGNIWRIGCGNGKSTTDKVAFIHPAIFPEQLANDHIISWSNECDLVYDPFMGSGTTAKMAILNKRNWIGSEISNGYCEIAERRILEIYNDKN